MMAKAANMARRNEAKCSALRPIGIDHKTRRWPNGTENRELRTENREMMRPKTPTKTPTKTTTKTLTEALIK